MDRNTYFTHPRSFHVLMIMLSKRSINKRARVEVLEDFKYCTSDANDTDLRGYPIEDACDDVSLQQGKRKFQLRIFFWHKTFFC